METARFSGAKIVGVNSNAYQLDRVRKLTEEPALTHLAEFIHCDFLAVDAPDDSFDAVYSIEATCCAPDKLSIYGEVFRLLKPGARFGVYEFCMTDRFDSQDPIHLKLKADLQLGGGLLNIDERQTVDNALRSMGSRCCKHGTSQNKPARRFPGISPWSVQVFHSPAFEAQGLDAMSRTIR